MLIEELPSAPSTSNNIEKPDPNLSSSVQPMITLKNVTAQWTPHTKVLDDINLIIQPRTLTAVVGQVGSGKTSLLHAVLGELPHSTGETYVHGHVSYAAQEPWIFAASIRQNILFGEPYDEVKYQRVVEICQLRRDLTGLPQGDMTTVGEKGINLSGGQCARLGLARAIYRDADVYLLDDPLSAVDSVVGKSIFQECIRIYLKEKTVILVTHQFQYLEEVDKIVVVSDGTIEATGTLVEVQAAGMNLGQVMQITNEFDELKDEQNKVQSKTANDDCASDDISEKEEPFTERKVGGSISARTYLSYILASRNMPLVVLVALASFLHQLAASSGDYFLAYWVNAEETATTKLLNNRTTCLEHVCTDRDWYIYVYGGITFATIGMCLLQSWTFFEMTMRIANNLHSNMFTSVIFATIDFFSANPLGRIMNRYDDQHLNVCARVCLCVYVNARPWATLTFIKEDNFKPLFRFSKDMSIVDTEVSRAMIDVIQNAIHIVAAFVVVTSVNPWLLVPAAVVACFFYLCSLFFIKTSRSIKRLEAISMLHKGLCVY